MPRPICYGHDAFLAKISELESPVITSITTDSGSSSSDGITNDTTLSITGTSTASATITVYLAGSTKLGTTTANGSGAWTYDYTGTTLAEGYHVFEATQTVSGEVSGRSELFEVLVDTDCGCRR